MNGNQRADTGVSNTEVIDLKRKLKEAYERLEALEPILKEMQSNLLDDTDSPTQFDAESIAYITKLHGYDFTRLLCQDLLNKHRNGIHSELWKSVVSGDYL